ncbi:MAG: orotate phosphoribosyltransferase, partial [Clostridia bacterium]|nr:orotate phosphoribosyltransferase [Clostridia bacterium]
SDGDRVVIIEDVITAGTAVRETLPQLKAAADVKVEHMIISVDRMERGQSGTTAIKEIGAEFGIKVHPIVTVREIIDHMHNREIDGEIPLNDEVRERMEKYLEMYCEK